MNNLPTFKQLRYLVTLEQHLHFGKAATACSVTQSAFSSAIKELEIILNVSLVDRTNRSVVFTPVGTRISSEARSVLQGLEGISHIASAAQRPLSGQLHLGVVPTVAPFVLPKLVPVLRRKFPALELHLREEKTLVIHQMLMNGDLDLMLLALPYELGNTETISIFNDKFKLAYNKDTELIDPDNYKHVTTSDNSILLLEDGHCMREHALSACNFAHKDKISNFSASGIYSLVQMVNSDLGITFIPQMAIDCGILKNTQVHTRDLEEDSHRVIGLAWRKSSARVKEFKLLAAVIRDCMRPDENT
ncbi:LysR family transcriptional regulator [Chromatiales bacterium (ex Bugula neritina AB1)]|nr:LysR family transcriptional regulator [Chromatiales bacterium (ex Bugula neritina AB1)]